MRIRTILGAWIGIAVLVGLIGLPGCSGGGAREVPASQQRRDEVQKSRELNKAGGSPTAKAPGSR